MAKTQQQYYEEAVAKGKKTIEEQYAKRQAADAAQMEQISAAIDKATQASTAQYEQSIADLPRQSRALYDENAMNEAVSRSRIQETLANMGLTDSGLSSSMATALTVQKGKADRQVSMNEQQQRQALMSAIDQILAGGESQKAENKIKMDQATRDWYDQVNAQMENSARESAATMYAADQEYAAAQIKAQQEAAKLQVDYDNQRRQYVQKQMMEGTSAEQAWANAYAVYPQSAPSDKNSQEYRDYVYTNTYYDMIRDGYTDAEINAYVNAGGGDAGAKAITDVLAPQAQSILSAMDLDFTAGGGGLLLRNPEKDGERVASRVLEQLNAIPTYTAMSQNAQEYTKAAAVGRMVANSFSNATQSQRNLERIKKACAQLGVNYKLALAYYEDTYTGKGTALYDWMTKNFADPYNTVSKSAVSTAPAATR